MTVSTNFSQSINELIELVLVNLEVAASQEAATERVTFRTLMNLREGSNLLSTAITQIQERYDSRDDVRAICSFQNLTQLIRYILDLKESVDAAIIQFCPSVFTDVDEVDDDTSVLLLAHLEDIADLSDNRG